MTDTPAKVAIAKRIIRLRGSHRINQKQLADAIGIDPSSMNRIEKGERSVSVAEIIRIADFFGVSTESLIREPQADSVLFRLEGPLDAAVEESLSLFKGVIRDYFGARATVS